VEAYLLTLSELFLDFNKISNLKPLLMYSRLELLSVAGNDIKSIPIGISKLKYLVHLTLDKNDIKSIPIAMCLDCVQYVFFPQEIL
jgi:Leucine-rich repeat (LRR) protein